MLEKKEKHLLILLTIWLFKKENRTKKQNIFYTKQTTERIQTWINIVDTFEVIYPDIFVSKFKWST